MSFSRAISSRVLESTQRLLKACGCFSGSHACPSAFPVEGTHLLWLPVTRLLAGADARVPAGAVLLPASLCFLKVLRDVCPQVPPLAPPPGLDRPSQSLHTQLSKFALLRRSAPFRTAQAPTVPEALQPSALRGCPGERFSPRGHVRAAPSPGPLAMC